MVGKMALNIFINSKKKLKKNVTTILYITYDGILDPLGESQIIPYIIGIKNKNRAIHILSFEKNSKTKKECLAMKVMLKQHNITWHNQNFTESFGLIGKIKDLIVMYIKASIISLRYSVNLIHARNHNAAEVGLFTKKIFRTKLIFDLRGLWVDERVDKGSWNLDNYFDQIQYKYYKHKERELLKYCDKLVVLSKAVVPEVLRLGAGQIDKITVIPCCADYKHFSMVDTKIKYKSREGFSIPEQAIVIGYLGSVGKMYRADIYIKLINLAIKGGHNVYGLVITKDNSDFIYKLNKYGTKETKDRVCIKSGSRPQIPKLLINMDILTSFIEPTYAKISSSPTKVGEALALGIPVISNAGIGDIAEITNQLNCGYVINNFSDFSILNICENLQNIKKLGGIDLRNRSRKVLGLEQGIKKYNQIYSDIIERI
tara:strand:- start:2537 stop:3823 length:1287 start_codon:yes stop_codon:yes gene_type:complete